MNTTKISDIISTYDIAMWRPSEPVIITAQTGAGKSYFIKNKLYKYARDNGKKILLLVHRLSCLMQFYMELEKADKFDVIKLSDYQRLENEYDADWLKNYDYIVCDEFHYFISDASFRNTTDISFEKIWNTKVTKIFISATPIDILGFMIKYSDDKLKPKMYSLPFDYSYISNLFICERDTAVYDFIDKVISTDSKGIIFMNNLEKARELYETYNEIALFNYGNSTNNKEYVQLIDKDKITETLRNEKFECNLLITTTCMDAGLNLVDKQLKYIYLDLPDVYEIVQCIGRKRIVDDTDTLEVWIKNKSRQDIGRLIGINKSQLSKANYLIINGEDAYKGKYWRKGDPYGIVYMDSNDNRYKINPLMKFRRECNIENYTQMNRLIEDGFAQIVSVNLCHIPYKIICDSRYEYLETHLDNVMLTRSDRESFILAMDFRTNGRRVKSQNGINDKLDQLKLPYYIKSFATHRVVDGKRKAFKNAWKIEKK